LKTDTGTSQANQPRAGRAKTAGKDPCPGLLARARGGRSYTILYSWQAHSNATLHL